MRAKPAVGILAAAWELAGDYPDGCAFVDLAPLSTAGLVVSTLASSLHLPVRTTTPLAALVRFLGGKRLLLVLDSCEHVIDEVSAVVEAIQRGAPKIDILATSREPLRIEAEWLQRLKSLSIPPPDKAITAAQALQFP